MAKKFNPAKDNARSFSRLARHIRKRNKDGNAEEIITILVAQRNLGAEIHQDIAPQLEAMAAAEAYTRNGYISTLENSPETYGMSVGQLQAKYHAPLAMHNGKNDADAEMDWQGTAIVNSTIHTGDVEKPL